MTSSFLGDFPGEKGIRVNGWKEFFSFFLFV